MYGPDGEEGDEGLTRVTSSKKQLRPPSSGGGKNKASQQSLTDLPESNEITGEIEIQNTVHHKAIIKARNENYLEFKGRFQMSLNEIMTTFDNERNEEARFSAYWNENLTELTVKHI